MKSILVFVSILMMMASSCTKVEEPKDHIPGSWGILTYSQNGVDKTQEYMNNHMAYKLTFDIKGNFTETWHTSTADFVVTGTWTLEKDNTELMMVDNDASSINKIRQYTISNLTATDCRLTLADEVIDIRKY
jgi:hypothetical protein